MNQEKRSSRICVILFSIAMLLSLSAAVHVLAQYNYRFPMIPNRRWFVRGTVVNVLGPVLASAGCGLAMCIQNVKASRWAALLLFLVFLVVAGYCIPRGAFEPLVAPTVVSFTDEVSDFGKYDDGLEKDFSHMPILLFPEEIPEYAENPQYMYFHSYNASNMVYMAVSWQCQTVEQFEKCQEAFPEKCTQTGGRCVAENMYGAYIAEAFFQEDSLQVSYVLTTCEGFLPQNPEDVLAWNPAEFISNID